MTQGMEKGMTKGMETDEIIVRCGTISMGQIHNELVHKYRILEYWYAIPVHQRNLLRYKQSYNSTCVAIGVSTTSKV